VRLNFSWFFGFGWVSVLALVVTGIGINLLSGPVVWLLYIPFLVVAIYMTVRFRLYTMHPWRRVHSRAMLYYAKYAEREYNQSQKAGRDFAAAAPCQELARTMFEENDMDVAQLLTDEGRKRYYKALVREFPEIFLKSFTNENESVVLEKIDRDIDASQLGPDILIARELELKYSRKEAATYLQSLMLGAVR